ncbi:MAG: SigB/SigF/SigG family RNA polymerase sigma factor [Clostridiales bacterium]|nr:SigB/SigF/SigG family RNA polymerase sigma factor [Clostridiales bacterium]
MSQTASASKNEILLDALRSGDASARETLISSNLGLVWSIVRKFAGHGRDTEDLFQIGSIGLIKCVDNFDPAYGVKFSTYAVPMILGEIRRFLRDDGMMRVSRALKETAKRANAARDELSQTAGREPTIAEVAEVIGEEPGEVILALESRGEVASLYQTTRVGDGGERFLIDALDAEPGAGDRLTDSIALRQVIDGLPPRERRIIILRYFRDKTQSEVASEVGVSQVQVSRLERKVLAEMRRKLEIGD